MEISTLKLKVNSFSTEIEEELNRNKRTVIQTEVEIYSEETLDNQDGTFTQVWKSKVVGSTICKQGEEIIKGKSKRTNSQKVRLKCFHDDPSEEYYDKFTTKLLERWEEVNDLIWK